MLIVLVSCKNQGHNHSIVIEGHVKNIPDGKVYLTDAYKWHVLLDSIESKGGRFKFETERTSEFNPHLASLSFHDATKPARLRQLLFHNHMRKDCMQHACSAFCLEIGYTRIEGELTDKPFLRVYENEKTDIYFSKYEFVYFTTSINVDCYKCYF